MKKNGILGTLILFILVALFNVVAFILPHTYTASFWWGYAFTMVALLAQTVFAFIAFKKANSLKKAFLGISIMQLGITYLVLQVIWGLVCMFSQVIPTKIAIVSSAILLGIYLIMIITAFAGKNIVQDVDDKVKINTIFIKSLLIDIESLSSKIENPDIKTSLKKLTETVKYSDPKSNETLIGIENKIRDNYKELENTVVKNDIDGSKAICTAINILFVERNKKCKLLK